MVGPARPRLLAAGVIALAIAFPAGARLWLAARPPDADLVITGRTVDGPQVSSAGTAAPSNNGPRAQPSEVIVHVAGAVKKPGLYHLSAAARADDAVKAAGGAAQDAYLDAINLAAPVSDGQQLYVPHKSEKSSGGAEQATPAAAVGKPSGHAGSTHSNKLTTPGQGTVNLNSASADDLQKLPGVGPAMAARILDYRKTNGGFRQIEDLMSVSGIGEKKFAKMKPFVRTR